MSDFLDFADFFMAEKSSAKLPEVFGEQIVFSCTTEGIHQGEKFFAVSSTFSNFLTDYFRSWIFQGIMINVALILSAVHWWSSPYFLNDLSFWWSDLLSSCRLSVNQGFFFLVRIVFVFSGACLSNELASMEFKFVTILFRSRFVDL